MSGPDRWQIIFAAAATLFVAAQMFMGWRRGIVRQAVALVALAAAYAAGWFGAHWSVPVVRPLGLPDALCAVVGGLGLGLVTFACITVLGDVLFKKTAQQSFFAVRWIYGAGGAVIGLVFGLFAVWVAAVGIRCLGTVAAAENAPPEGDRADPPRRVVTGLAQMKDSLDRSAAGPFFKRIDPIPDGAYTTLSKVARVASDAESAQRFLRYPGAARLLNYPKILALRDDPALQKSFADRNLVALLTNEKIVRATNDPEVARLVKEFEFLKALDYATKR